jgi:hypothetical protein
MFLYRGSLIQIQSSGSSTLGFRSLTFSGNNRPVGSSIPCVRAVLRLASASNTAMENRGWCSAGVGRGDAACHVVK